MPSRATAAIALGLLVLSATMSPAQEIVTGVTRDQVAAILRDSGYRAEIVADGSSSTGPFIRTGMGGHTVAVFFFNCAADKCAAIQFWAGYRKSPKFTSALVEKWNTEIRYAKTHLTAEGALHMEYDVHLAGGVSAGYIKAAAALYGSLLGRLDDFIKAAPASAPPAAAGAMSNIEALVAQGKFADAIAALDEAAAAYWERMPMTFRRALWVAAVPDGYGAYNPRENNVFASGVKMSAYVEPVGFVWRRNGDIFEADLVTDITVKGKDGAVLLQKEDFQRLRMASRVRNREFMTHIAYTFTGIPVGDYVLETLVRDKVSGKSGTFVLPFVVR